MPFTLGENSEKGTPENFLFNIQTNESESESEVAQSCPTLCNPWTIAHQAPPSMGFSRQEYWSGLPFPSPGGLCDPGIEPRSPTLQADTFNHCTTFNSTLQVTCKSMTKFQPS